MLYKDPSDEHYHEVTETGDRYQEIKVTRETLASEVATSTAELLILAVRLAPWRDKPAAIAKALRWVWRG